MASHSRPYGEPRTVAGYEVSFMITEFSRSVARSLDVYAKDGDEEVLLTEESIDNEPDDGEIERLLDLACEDGRLPCKWIAEYQLWSLVADAVASEDKCTVTARTEEDATKAAIDWVHENDPFHDARIDPRVDITYIIRVPVGNE